MTEDLRVEVSLADSKVSAPARIGFENIQDPLIGLKEPLEGFFDPLEGMKALDGRTARVIIGRAEKSSLNVRSGGQDKPAFALHLEPGDSANRLLERFGTEQEATISVSRAGDAYRVVVNHEEQYSRPKGM